MNSYYQQSPSQYNLMTNRNSSSPVNLAFENKMSSNHNNTLPKILPPFPQTDHIQQKKGEDDFDNLRDFRSKILEMDDEIRELKRLEQEKMRQPMQYNHYDNECSHRNVNTNNNNNNINENNEYRFSQHQKDQSNATTDLIEEQNNRIMMLQNQLEMLKNQLTPVFENTTRTTEDRNYVNDAIRNPNECKATAINREYDDERQRRMGQWSPKDPYQGPMNNLYFPFGSPGGGAPIKDKEGNLQTTLYGPQTLYRHPEETKMKTLASHILQENMRQDMLQQRLRKLQDRQQIREPEGDLSDILSNFKVGRPKRDPSTGILIDNHLPSSDVTNIRHGNSPRVPSPVRDEFQNYQTHKHQQHEVHQAPESNSNIYGAELARAAREREMMRRLEKLREQQEVRQHNDSWDHLWGNSGLMQQSPKTVLYNNYPPYIRRSNHRNHYELSNQS